MEHRNHDRKERRTLREGGRTEGGSELSPETTLQWRYSPEKTDGIDIKEGSGRSRHGKLDNG